MRFLAKDIRHRHFHWKPRIVMTLTWSSFVAPLFVIYNICATNDDNVGIRQTLTFQWSAFSPVYRLSFQGFEHHINVEHHIWAYIFFFIHLFDTKQSDYTALELYVYKLVSADNCPPDGIHKWLGGGGWQHSAQDRVLFQYKGRSSFRVQRFPFTENRKLSWYQLYHHWWHRKLLWQPAVPLVTRKLASRRLPVFSVMKVRSSLDLRIFITGVSLLLRRHHLLLKRSPGHSGGGKQRTEI